MNRGGAKYPHILNVRFSFYSVTKGTEIRTSSLAGRKSSVQRKNPVLHGNSSAVIFVGFSAVPAVIVLKGLPQNKKEKNASPVKFLNP